MVTILSAAVVNIFKFVYRVNNIILDSYNIIFVSIPSFYSIYLCLYNDHNIIYVNKLNNL